MPTWITKMQQLYNDVQQQEQIRMQGVVAAMMTFVDAQKPAEPYFKDAKCAHDSSQISQLNSFDVIGLSCPCLRFHPSHPTSAPTLPRLPTRSILPRTSPSGFKLTRRRLSPPRPPSTTLGMYAPPSESVMSNDCQYHSPLLPLPLPQPAIFLLLFLTHLSLSPSPAFSSRLSSLLLFDMAPSQLPQVGLPLLLLLLAQPWPRTRGTGR